MSGPMMPRPTVVAGVVANMAMAQILVGSSRDLCIGAINGRARVLALLSPLYRAAPWPRATGPKMARH